MQPEGTQQRRRGPVYLNLLKITLPPGGWVSILHRVGGLLLVFATPFLLWLMGRSLQDERGYAQAVALLASPLARLLLWVVGVALLHHLLAGVRHLLLDLQIAIDKAPARRSAFVVLTLDALGAMLLGAMLWP